MNAEAISLPSTEVFLFLYSFKDLIPLILHQWYIHHIHRVIRLGLLEPYPWIITHISTTEFQNDFSFAGEKQKKKAKKGESATLATSSRVLVSFAHYRVVICLDVSESSFTWTSVLTEALLSILSEISVNTKSNKRIMGVHLSIIAHLPEIDETWSIWQGEVTSESDVTMLQSLVRSRIERVEEQSIKAKALAAHNVSRTNYYRFPESETFLKAILFHLRLLPGEACPKAILLTGGSMTIKTGSTALINHFCRDLISLDILVDLIPNDRPIGFYSDFCGLQLLVAQTVGGSVDALQSTSTASINDVCRRFVGKSFFNFPAFGCHADSGKNSKSLMRQMDSYSLDCSDTPRGNNISSIAPEDMMRPNKHDVNIKCYQCEGATVEHLLSVRVCEGFKIVDVKLERENMLSIHATQSGPVFPNQVMRNGMKKAPFMTYSRHHAQQHQPLTTMLIIRLEKRISKLLTLIYQVSYRRDDQVNKQSNPFYTSRQFNPRSPVSQVYSPTLGLSVPKGSQIQGSKTHVKQSWEKAVGGESVSAEELEKLFDKISENLSWSKGPITVDMWGLNVQGRDRHPLKISMGDRDRDREGSTITNNVNSNSNSNRGYRAILAMAESIAERDESIAALLGVDHMPGAASDTTPYQDVRIRSVPISSSRYRLSRTNANPSSGSLQSHAKSPSVASKSTSRFDDHSTSPHDDVDAKKNLSPKGNLQWLTCKRISQNTVLLDELCALDKVLLFHIFLASYDLASDGVVTKDERNPEGEREREREREREGRKPPAQTPNNILSSHVLKTIFDGIAMNLPNPDMRRITPFKCMYVISNKSKEEASLGMASVEFGVIVVELTQRDDVFLSFKISKLTKGCGQMSALVKIVVKTFFLTLKVCGLRAIKVKNDLSLSSLARTVSTFQRKMVEACMATARSLSALNCRKRSNLLLLMSEIVQSKISLGFQLPQGGTIGGEIGQYSVGCDNDGGLEQPMVSHLFAVSSRSPLGIEMEALLQCIITCSSDGCTVDYYWPKPLFDSQYESSALGVYCNAGAQSSRAIESAITACIGKDHDIFRLYETAFPLMTSSPALLLNQKAARVVSLSEQEWGNLLRQADKEYISLPIFGNSSKTNLLLLEMLAGNLTHYSAVTVATIPALALPDSVSPLRQRSPYIRSKIPSPLTLTDSDAHTRNAPLHHRMVISARNCLIFIEFPPAVSHSSPDTLNLIDHFDDPTVKDSPRPMAEEEKVKEKEKEKEEVLGQLDISLQNEDSYFIDAVELDIDSNDEKSEGLPERLSGSAAQGDDSGDTTPQGAFLMSSIAFPVPPDTPALPPAEPKSCVISVYSLQLPTFRFVDQALRSIVSQAVAVPNLSKAGSGLSHVSSGLSEEIREDLRSFIRESHLDNYATVLCSAMRDGEAVAKGDIQLGLDRCSQSIYEVDISVMCRKRYLANMTVGGEILGPSAGSLCSAFENTLGRLLKGLEHENVFVLTNDTSTATALNAGGSGGGGGVIDGSVGAIVGVTAGSSGGVSGVSSSDRPAVGARSKSNDLLHSETASNIASNISDSTRPDLPNIRLSSTSVESDTYIGSNPEVSATGPGTPRIDFIDNRLVEKIAHSKEHSSKDLMKNVPSTKVEESPLSKVPPPKSPHLVPEPTHPAPIAQPTSIKTTSDIETARDRGKATFVRFAVVSRTEKPVQAASLSGPPFSQLGTSGSYQSLATMGSITTANAPSTGTGAGTYGNGGTGTPGAEDSQGSFSGFVHPLPCSAFGLSHALHSLCAGFGQVLETTTHSTVAATEVALRMVYLHSSKEEEEPSAVDKERPSLTENASPTGSEHEYTPALKVKKNDTLKSCVGPERGVFFERLSQEMTVFVASDTLNSLLVASSSNITAETLILVQHCLNDIPALVQTVHSNLNFVCPATSVTAKRAGGSLQSAQQQTSYTNSNAAQYDPVVTAFESELREEIAGLSKIGDTLYARSWCMRNSYLTKERNTEGQQSSRTENTSVRTPRVDMDFKEQTRPGDERSRVSDVKVDSGSVRTRASSVESQLGKGGEKGAEKGTDGPLVVACWILIALSHSLVPEGDVPSGTATTSMKVTVALRRSDTDDGTQDKARNSSEEPQTLDSDSMCADRLQNVIAEELRLVLEKCSFKVNQRLLLRDMFVSNIASPFLLAPVTSSQAVSGSLLAPAASSSPASINQSTSSSISVPIAPSPAPSQDGPVSKQKSTVFNQTVPPRRRPPIPTLSVVIKKDLGPGGIGNIPAVPPPAAVTEDPVKLCFPPGKFSCSRQGEVICMIHGWAALSHENAVRHLESSALEKLTVLNHKKYFVSEDSQFNVVYLTFDPPVDRDTVRLGVYGTHPVDKIFCEQVQIMLNQRLIEITAKTVSRILTQNASLHASYITFLKQSGATRHLTMSFALPNYVQDVYFYCTIARQIFLNSQVLTRVAVSMLGAGDKKASGASSSNAVKSASELIHPSGFGYNLLHEAGTSHTETNSVPATPDQLASRLPSSSSPFSQPTQVQHQHPKFHSAPSPTSTSSSTFASSKQSNNFSLTHPEDRDAILQDIPSPRPSYATAVKSPPSHPESIPRKIFGDTPSTGFGVKKKHVSSSRPKLVRKGHVEEEIHNPAIISPVFFGKKRNLQRPRREFIFDETLVVWQRSEFTFLYNQLGPPTGNSPAQYKHLVKQIGQGLALMELIPQNVQSPASAFPFANSSSVSPLRGGAQTHIPNPTQALPSLILLSGSQTALEEDMKAIRHHLTKNEKFHLLPVVPTPPTPGASPGSTDSSPPKPLSKKSLLGDDSDEVDELTVATGLKNLLPPSVSEIHLKFFPTIPMQTQALADFCTACLEKALTVYCVERLMSACGNGMISPTPTLPTLTVVPPEGNKASLKSKMSPSETKRPEAGVTPLRSTTKSLRAPDTGPKSNQTTGRLTVNTSVTAEDGSEGNVNAFHGDKKKKEDSLGTPGRNILPTSVCADYLRLHHGALGAAATSPFFLNRSSGILHIPFLLPKQKAYMVRTQIVERIVEAYPQLQNPSAECHCRPLFLKAETNGTGTVWCESGSTSSVQCNSTVLGAAHLFPQYNSPASAPSTSTTSPYHKPSDLGNLSNTQLSGLSTGSNSHTSMTGNGNSNNNSSNNFMGGSGSNSNMQGEVRERRANSRDRSNSFTPPLNLSNLSNAFGSTGDLRFLLDYDAGIASTLPLWLRRRAFSLEISVSTEGIYVFFYNLSPFLVNSVCEISVTFAAAEVKAHNEQIREQLVMLGVLKERALTTPRTPESARKLDDVTHSSVPAPSSSSSTASPMKTVPSLSSSPFPSSANVVSALTGSGAAISSATLAATVQRPELKCLEMPSEDQSAVQGDKEKFNLPWVQQVISRLSWEKRTVEKLFLGPGSKTSTRSSFGLRKEGGAGGSGGWGLGNIGGWWVSSPPVSELECLRIVPERAWRQGATVKRYAVPLPHVQSPSAASSPLDRIGTVSKATSGVFSDRSSVSGTASPANVDSILSFQAYEHVLHRMGGVCGCDVFRSTASSETPSVSVRSDSNSNEKILNSRFPAPLNLGGYESDSSPARHKGYEKKEGREAIFIAAPIPRSATIAVAEIAYIPAEEHHRETGGPSPGLRTVHSDPGSDGVGMSRRGEDEEKARGEGPRTSDSESAQQAETSGPHVLITIRVMSIFDVLKACLPFSNDEVDRVEKTKLRKAGYDILAATCGTSESDFKPTGQLPWDIIDHHVVQKLQQNVLFGILSVFELATFSRSPRPTGGPNRSHRCADRDQRDIAIILLLSSLLPDNILLDERHVPVLESPTLSSTTLGREREAALSAGTEQRLLCDPSVSQMMDAIGGGGDVYAVGSERVGSFVCFPFECSLLQLNSARPPPPRAFTAHRSLNNVLGDDRHLKGLDLNSKTDPGFTPFAMGFTLAYIDKNTPKDSVTALTVAYHSGDRTYPRLRSSDSSDSSTRPRISVYPLHIQIPDISSRIPAARVMSGESLSCSMRDVEDEKGMRLLKNQNRDSDTAASSAARGYGEEKLDVSAAGMRRSEGGLLCFVTEEISSHLSQLFVSARETVHLKMGWNVLQRDSLVPLKVVKGSICNMGDEAGQMGGAETSDAVTKGGDIDVISYFTRQRNAWVMSEEVRRLLLYLIEHTPAVPLNCLHGLHSALLVIAQTLSKHSDTNGTTNSTALEAAASEHLGLTGQGVSGPSQSHGQVLLDKLLCNLSTAFQNRCRCFIIGDEKTITVEEDTERQSKGVTTDHAGEGSRSVLHILVSLQPRLHCVGKEENFAVHICVPSLPDRSHHAISPRFNSNNDVYSHKIDNNRSAELKPKSRTKKCAEKMPYIHLIEGSTGNHTASPVDIPTVINDPNSVEEEKRQLSDSLEKRKEQLISQVANVILYTMSSVL